MNTDTQQLPVSHRLGVELPLHHLHEVLVGHGEGHVRLPAERALVHAAAAVLQIDGYRREMMLNH